MLWGGAMVEGGATLEDGVLGAAAGEGLVPLREASSLLPGRLVLSRRSH